MNVILHFWITFLMVYGAEADISKHFTYLGRTGSKTFYMSNVTRNYNEAISTCTYFNMVLARLETKKEHDDLNFIFTNSVKLPDRAYVGLSLLNGKAIQHESKFTTTYNVLFYPGNPSGDGTCLEILRERGHTGMNDLSCANIRHFICETKDRANEVTTSEPESEIIKLKEEISSLQGKNDELNVDFKQCLKNLIEIKDEKASKLNRCTDKNDNLTSELNVCQSQQNRSQENKEIRLFNHTLMKLIDELKQNIDSLRLYIDLLNIGNSVYPRNNTNGSTEFQSDSTKNCDPRDVIDVRMGVECENGRIVRSNGNATECACPVGFTGATCQHKEPLGQACYMEGNGYVELNRSSIVDGGSSQRSVFLGLRFSTTQSKGLLFWFGQDNLESSNEQDFMALFIEKRHLVYVFRLNGIEHRVSSSITINNGQQHSVILRQIGHEGSMELPHYDEFISGHIDTINKDSKIDLPGNVFLGGAPNLIEFTGGRYVDGFVGCIHIVANENDEMIDLGKNAVSSLNVGICPE